MSGKSRAFAVAAAAAGVIGMWAPAASAVTGPVSGDNGGVVNVSHNQVPVQVCNDTVPVNVLGVQVPVDRVAGSLGLLTAGTNTATSQDNSCHQASAQGNAGPGHHEMAAKDMAAQNWEGVKGWHVAGPKSGDNGGVVNISHNQVPIQVCNDKVPVNVLGVQVPVDEVAAALGVLTPASSQVTVQDNSCHQAQAQKNGR
jgi:Tfp pilus assembly protein PilV